MSKNNFYLIHYAVDAAGRRGDTPTFVAKMEDGKITINGPRKAVERWSDYFQNDENWKKIHLKAKNPFESLFSLSSFSGAVSFDEEGLPEYETALLSVKNEKEVTIGLTKFKSVQIVD